MKNTGTIFLLVLLTILPGPLLAGDRPACSKLEQPVTGEAKKYSLTASVNGPVAFEDMACAASYRQELCAMELVAFDTTASVYDYNTGEKLQMAQAFFVVWRPADAVRIIAFSDPDTAAVFAAGRESATVIDYDQLTAMDYSVAGADTAAADADRDAPRADTDTPNQTGNKELP